MNQHTYIAIDLKSFYASVECISRDLSPLTTNLVVADISRTEKTICLAVTPALKSVGLPGRPRLFEVVQKVNEINALRRMKAPGKRLEGESFDASVLDTCPEKALSYIVAPPRMAHYLECSAKIYSIYLRYISPEDIHVYSIDEVFIDATSYLKTYRLSARQLAKRILDEVLAETGITATVGIAPNLYLCKIAMDIVAKRIVPDDQGARIAELTEESYRRLLWDHRPLTDFWRVGRGYAKKLESYGMYTMGDIARCSVGAPEEPRNEKLLYKLFGVNAELLIDHAWGWEPCTIADIKAYRPENKSICSGQVFQGPCNYDTTRLIIREMADAMALDLVDKALVTDQLVLTVGYDRENLTRPEIASKYKGPVTKDGYGRAIPKHAHGTFNLTEATSATSDITEAVMELFDRIADPSLLARRVTLTANRVISEADADMNTAPEQIDMFADSRALAKRRAALARERNIQKAVIHLKKKYGKNTLFKGMNMQEGATGLLRNKQIGGHRA